MNINYEINTEYNITTVSLETDRGTFSGTYPGTDHDIEVLKAEVLEKLSTHKEPQNNEHGVKYYP